MRKGEKGKACKQLKPPKNEENTCHFLQIENFEEIRNFEQILFLGKQTLQAPYLKN